MNPKEAIKKLYDQWQEFTNQNFPDNESLNT